MSEKKSKLKKSREGGAHGGMGFGPGMQKEKAKNFKSTMKKLIRYLSVYKLSFLLCVCVCDCQCRLCHCWTENIRKSHNEAF